MDFDGKILTDILKVDVLAPSQTQSQTQENGQKTLNICIKWVKTSKRFRKRKQNNNLFSLHKQIKKIAQRHLNFAHLCDCEMVTFRNSGYEQHQIKCLDFI